MFEVKEAKDGLLFSVYVQPRASKCCIIGCHDQSLKIKLTAPPVGGAANKQCIETLSKALAIPKSTLEIVGGRTHRVKQIKIHLPQDGRSKTAMESLKSKLLQLALG